MSVISCGLIVISPKGWLLARATGTKRWDLPKGKQEEGETPLQTALRETLEETNLDFSHETTFEDLGQHAYLPKKRLHLFRLYLPEAWDLSGCSCSTYVEWEGRAKFLETDRWEWVKEDDVLQRVGKSLGKLLTRENLLVSYPAVLKDEITSKSTTAMI